MSWVEQVRLPRADPFDAADPLSLGDSPRMGWQLAYERRRPLPAFASEADLAQHVLRELAAHFAVRPEISGTHCTGRRVRIDAVLVPHDTSAWADGDRTALGVEFKLPVGGRVITKLVAQCFDYSHTEWDGFGRLPIFACPGARLGWGDEADMAVAHVLGQVGVGELVLLDRYGWSLVRNQVHRQWSQARGVEDARRTRLRPKVGSR